jgi:hypoxanthine phosphoribosyltransferase
VGGRVWEKRHGLRIGEVGFIIPAMDAELGLLFTRDEIATAVNRLAAEISRDYRDKNPLLIAVLKGSFVFLADLIRRLDFPLEIEFVRLSSYGKGTESSGRVRMAPGSAPKIRGRHVLVIEDIIDTGLTAAFLLDYLRRRKPASLKLCTLTDKKARRRVIVNIDYQGLTVPDEFIVGYGIDCGERYRHLPDIYYIKQ